MMSKNLLVRWVQRAFFTIVNIFRRGRIRDAVQDAVGVPSFITLDGPEQYKEAKRALDECFFGSFAKRDPGSSLSKEKHLHDGWREGFSHPFHWEGKIYDVGEGIDESVTQYHELHGRIKARFFGENKHGQL